MPVLRSLHLLFMDQTSSMLPFGEFSVLTYLPVYDMEGIPTSYYVISDSPLSASLHKIVPQITATKEHGLW